MGLFLFAIFFMLLAVFLAWERSEKKEQAKKQEQLELYNWTKESKNLKEAGKKAWDDINARN